MFVRTESREHYCWAGLLAPLHTPLYSPRVYRSDDTLLWLFSGLFLMFVCVIFTSWFLPKFPFSHLLTFTNLTPLSSFFCCLLFQLRVLLKACLLSSILSSWLRILYGSVILGSVLCYFLLPVVPLLLLASWTRRFWLYDKVCTLLYAIRWLAVGFRAFNNFFS